MHLWVYCWSRRTRSQSFARELKKREWIVCKTEQRKNAKIKNWVDRSVLVMIASVNLREYRRSSLELIQSIELLCIQTFAQFQSDANSLRNRLKKMKRTSTAEKANCKFLECRNCGYKMFIKVMHGIQFSQERCVCDRNGVICHSSTAKKIIIFLSALTYARCTYTVVLLTGCHSAISVSLFFFIYFFFQKRIKNTSS